MKIKIINHSWRLHSWRLMLSTLVVIILIIFLGMMVGFPWERTKMADVVKQYVEEEYGLSVTDVKVWMSIDGMNSVRVSTKELPFNFDVFITRDDMRIFGDLYLEEFVECSIEEIIKDRIDGLPDGYKINVVLENRFSKQHPEITIEDIAADPDSVFNTPVVQFHCLIYADEVNHEKCYSISKKITEQFNPTCINFYHNKNQDEAFLKIGTQGDGSIATIRTQK